MKTEKASIKLDSYELDRCRQAMIFFDELSELVDKAEKIFTKIDCDYYSSSIISADEDEKGFIPTYSVKDMRELLHKIYEEKSFHIYKDRKEEN